jgi:hypothetical protein
VLRLPALVLASGARREALDPFLGSQEGESPISEVTWCTAGSGAGGELQRADAAGGDGEPRGDGGGAAAEGAGGGRVAAGERPPACSPRSGGSYRKPRQSVLAGATDRSAP